MNPGLRINALKLTATTTSGEVGRTLEFAPGLNLLRADNSSGKSTALQGIVYALGLEGMLSPTQRIPLTHAMTDRVAVHGVESNVLESRVELQISNAAGECLTIIRSVVHPERDSRLITVVEGPQMTSPGQYRRSDYFVRVRGAAQNDAGFHRYLAEFIGLDLPRVTKFDGSETPLYLETLLPYSFVEQKHGWTGIEARIPSYFGIRDVSKRTAEFVLGLEVFDLILQRQRLNSNMAELEATWQVAMAEMLDVAKSANVVVADPPRRIADGVASAARAVVSIDGAWIPIGEASRDLAERVRASAQSEVRTVGESSDLLESELATREAGMHQALGIAAALADELDELVRRVEQVDLHIENLRDDLQKHQDSRLLQSFGSRYSRSLVGEHVCPTCHQDVADGLDVAAHVMSVDENIEFIQRQLATFTATRHDLSRVSEAVAARLQSVRSQIVSFRTEVRRTRESLTSSNSSLSVADISRRLAMETRGETLATVEEKIATIRSHTVDLSVQWSEQKRLLSEASKEGLSERDAATIASVERSVRSQLSSYGFESLNPDEIVIDPISYRPTHEGFDLGFDLSASDMIRVIWAYLFALLNAGQRVGNHLGLLIFDEPKQQDTARASYQALLAHASGQGIEGSQVIFATSEDSDSLIRMLGTNDYNLINLSPGEKLLQPGS